MPNMELLDKVLGHIKANPETWNQADYRCGTTYCFAGHAALMSGWKPVGPDKDLAWRVAGFESAEQGIAYYQRQLKRVPEGAYADSVVASWKGNIENINAKVDNRDPEVTLTGAEKAAIADVARDVLDLDGDTAGTLFQSGNSLSDLEEMVEEIRENGYLDPWSW